MKFSIINLNLWLLPFRLSRHNNERLIKLIGFIREKQPEFVALQEVWQRKYIRILQKNLPEYFFTFKAGLIRNPSGLVILAKEKPKNFEFFPFKKMRGKGIYNHVARKGVLVAKFKDVVVYNTHLHHRSDGEKIMILKKEFDFVKSKIKVGNNIICGDFNLVYPQFEEFNDGFYIHADNLENTFSTDNSYISKWYYQKVVGNKKIDYILLKLPEGISYSYRSQIIKNPTVSDHYGIYSEIELK